MPMPQVNTGPSEGGSFWNSVGGILADYAAGRVQVDLENRRDQIETPDRVDHVDDASRPAVQTAASVVSNITPAQWAIAGVAGVVGLILVVKLVSD